MRYDTLISFVKFRRGNYNAETGNYEKASPEKTVTHASVMNAGQETMRLLYGEIRQGSLVVQIQGHFEQPFDRIEIAGKMYAVDQRRRLRTKETFIVSEVQ